MTNDQIEIKFKRDLKFIDLINVGVGAMTGATIYMMAGQAVQYSGTAIFLVLFFNYLVTILTAMTYAELSTIYPEAGGGYLFVEEALPKPFGFMGGWMSWFSHSIADSFYSVTFATGIVWLMELYSIQIPLNVGLFIKILAVIIIGIIIFINFWGTKTTGRSQTMINLTQIFLIIVIAGLGIYGIFTRHVNPINNIFPITGTPIGILLAMGLLFVGFEGYEIIAQGAEEIENPKKNLPRAILLSVTIVTVLYVFLFFAMIGLIGPSLFASWGNDAVFNYGRYTMGQIGASLVLLALLFGASATLNATVYSSIRVSFAMGRNGSLPKSFAKMHYKRRTPYVATFVSGAIISIMAVSFPLDTIVAAASIMFLLLFTLVNIAVIVNRYKNPNVKAEWRIPLFPLIPILAIFTKLLVAFTLWIFSPEAWYVAILWIEVGLIIYYFWSGKKEIEHGQIIKPTTGVTELKKNSIMVAVAEEDTNSVKLAAQISRNTGGELYIYHVYEVPKTVSPYAMRYNDIDREIKMMERLEKQAKKFKRSVSSILQVSHDTYNAIQDELNEKKIKILFLSWRKKYIGSKIERFYKNQKTDMIIFKNNIPEKINRINIIISKRRSYKFALDVGIKLSTENNAEIYIYSFSAEKKFLENVENYLNDIHVTYNIENLNRENIIDKIKEIINKGDLTVMVSPSELMEKHIPVMAEISIISELNGPFLITKKMQDELKNEDYSLMHHT